MVELQKEHYQANAVIIWCFNARFKPALEGLIEELNLGMVDIVTTAGGAKDLAVAEKPEYRDALLRQIEISIKLHGTRRIILMIHEDCGALGGSSAFENNTDKEFKACEKYLTQAREVVEARFPDAIIEMYFCNFKSCIVI
ncbi:MAG: hypothetical protein COU08_04140 [Candidatus Harrisonbacteria bacterium CG10_big_fil_rev_8_21_14_0_10_42_17]|uniref:Carbonic anhydrase n=1 Tax=Candidatus Harrisonbacteria bacterium CG10_big_fil_rev_8_21_14_0_10_42_17 TaxID=1974584 RepID=A0A2M6WGV8_9BACT|nr:MAG: hypothetical protein COU08_04140 [Candidatus Harrisonbacteria bacterium CG10_big_fil_rev_8_21_14_0_10_42_17]